MYYNVLDIAEYTILKCIDNKKSISHLKLQKVLYFIQAAFLVILNKPCFNEDIEAWTYGPVVREVYRKYSMYGGNNINFINKTILPEFEREEKNILDKIIYNCSSYSAGELVEMTHRQDPWIKTYNNGKGLHDVIKHDLIIEYFSSRKNN